MHTCIGSPCGGNHVFSRFQPGQGRLNRALHRRLIDLPLPADKGRTMIFNKKGVTGHGFRLGGASDKINPYTSRIAVPILL